MHKTINFLVDWPRAWYLAMLIVDFSLVSTVDPNTLNLDPDPELWPNLDPDSKLCHQF